LDASRETAQNTCNYYHCCEFFCFRRTRSEGFRWEVFSFSRDIDLQEKKEKAQLKKERKTSQVNEKNTQQVPRGGMEIESTEQTKRRRSVVVVGIPGVGKSTVIDKMVQALKARNIPAQVVNYGTVMLERASKEYGVNSRDSIRKLPVEAQRKIQVKAATAISMMRNGFIIVDTHLFISTPEGFWPGMPIDVLQALRPTHIVLVTASPEEIIERRKKDTSRIRENVQRESVELELEAAKSLLFASSLICACPVLVVHNEENKVEETAQSILNAIG
jgi:adenylate kinase